MRAMILAAGLGTRLRPLTDDRPKALVEINGRTLLEITLARLSSFGIREVIVNAHHFAGKMIECLQANDNFGMRVEVSREDELLDTGGGLKKAEHFFLQDRSGEPFILHNVDVLSSIDLNKMIAFHRERQALATLAVQQRETSRPLLFDDQLRLGGRKSQDDNRTLALAARCQELAFCGIHVISPRIFEVMTEKGAFSIIDSYLRLADRGEKILAFRADRYYWRDVGKPESVLKAAQESDRWAEDRNPT